MSMDKTYINVEGMEKIPETEYIPAGKRFDAFVMTCEENGFTSLQRRRGINLIWEGMLPKLQASAYHRLDCGGGSAGGCYGRHHRIQWDDRNTRHL